METTKVVIAQSNSKSLRTTIPAGIARQFGIGAGSELGWEIEARDNKLLIVVRPIVMVSRPETDAPEPEAPKRGRKRASSAPGDR
jgi:bifunctional DNA-binding transcriptional regulator/antitoxin component of YhaV-PrlF toxin-antitoxin module